MMLRFAFHFLLFLVLVPAAGLARPQDPFVGRWSGETESGMPLSLVVQRRGDGFEIGIDHAEITLKNTAFSPSDRPGVFEERVDGGLFSLFSGSETKVLHEAPVLWARFDGPALVVYRLDVARNGRMKLDHIRLEVSEERLAASLERMVNGVMTLEEKAWLEQMP